MADTREPVSAVHRRAFYCELVLADVPLVVTFDSRDPAARAAVAARYRLTPEAAEKAREQARESAALVTAVLGRDEG